MSLLKNALAALEEGNASLAFEHALEAWREHKAPDLAEVVEQLSAYAARDVSPPRAKTPKARHLAWLKAAETGNALERHVLFETVVAIRSNKLTAERVLALTARGPDPRFTTCAFSFIYTAPFSAATSRTSKVYRAVFDGLTANGDVRAVGPLQSLDEDMADKVIVSARESVVKRATRALKKLEPLAVPTLTLEEQATCAAIAEIVQRLNGEAVAREQDGLQTETVLAEIFANPSDLGLRHVLGDLLSERGDPFGEFLQLQLRDAENTLTSKERTRMNTLQKLHGDEFLHGLGPHIAKTQRKFELGFLVQAKTQKLVNHPAFATVRTLIGAHPQRDEHPLRSVESIVSTFGNCVADLHTLTKPLPHLRSLIVSGPNWEERGKGRHAWWDDGFREQFNALTVLPNLRRLGFNGSVFWSWKTGPRPTDFDWLWEAQWISPLKHLLLVVHPSLIPEWVEVARERSLSSLVLADVFAHPHPFEAQFVFSSAGADVTLVTGKRRGRVEGIDRVLTYLAKVGQIRSLTIDSRFKSAYEGSRAALIEDPAFGEVRFGTARYQLER